LTCCACCPRPDQPDIAQALYLSEATVRNYVIAIFTKLNVSDRTQAAILALRAGLGDRS
jgi:DNA-binding NarL/FixJ family response regulator